MSTEIKGLKNMGLWPVNPAGGWADRPVCNLNLGICGVLAASLRASSGEPMRINPEN